MAASRKDVVEVRGFLVGGGAAGEEEGGASREAADVGGTLRFFSLVFFEADESALAPWLAEEGPAEEVDGAAEQPKSRWSPTDCSVVNLPQTGLRAW